MWKKALIGVGLLAAVTAAPAAVPDQPRARVDTALPPVRASILVRAGDDLQAALDKAQPGDAVLLEAGATFTGPFTLRARTGDEWVTVRPAVPDDRLPPPGTRVGPGDAGAMPKLESRTEPVVQAAPGAHHYRFVGIEVRPKPGVFLHNLVALGSGETTAAELPHHLVFDRCYLHGDPAKGSRRGIALNSRETAVVDSYLADFKEAGADSQAIAGWNGPGPFRIENNYLEAAGEAVMFGGADPSIPNLVPSDIEVRRNHFSRPLAWRTAAWTVKNLFELKNARRVLVDGNLLENHWVQAQSGFAVLFTVRNQDGWAPWSVVEDVTFSNNVVRHVAAGINILGRDDNFPSGQTRRVAIRNNLFDDVGGPQWGGGGTLLQVVRGALDVAFEHNTAFQSGLILAAEGEPNPGFVYRNNIALHNAYGMIGTGTAPGRETLAAYFPGAVVARNVFVGSHPSPLPADNFFPPSAAEVGFVDRVAGDYRLAPTSPYRGRGTDGKDVGVDFAEVGPAPVSAPVAGPAPAAADDPGAWRVSRGWAAAAVFWSAGLLLAYTHVGYPLLVWAWARLRSRPLRRRRHHQPTVSVVVVARNEAARLQGRVDNLLALDYPPDRLEVLLASDGSTDGTDELARSFEARAVRVFAFPVARGKPAVLNELVPQARGEIVVLADARQRFEPGALRALVADFADPSVGAVSGELVLAGNAGGTSLGEGVGFYWRYEKFMRKSESRLDSTVGATGALYAIRRRLFEPIPEDTLLDDVLIPVRIAERGYRSVFEPDARAWDRSAASAAEEFRRKVRTIAGNFQLFARNAWLLDPRRNRLWLQTLSHKGLRLLTPLLLAAALLANLALIGSAFYRLALAGQAAFYAAAASGFVLRNLPRRIPLLSVPYVICLLAWATVVAFLRFVSGRQPVTWERASA
jgi:cellulose synthase/poly-beta-1,6-N-acetylglucosamine synthase-like glycosyltransferase